MDYTAIQRAAAALPQWSPPALEEGIPHGDMPGDKVEIHREHIEKANTIFPLLLPMAAAPAPVTARPTPHLQRWCWRSSRRSWSGAPARRRSFFPRAARC